jgi:dienelactone hydrolase
MSARWGWMVVGCLVALPAAAAGLALAFYVAGNGLVAGAFALATVPFGLLVAPGVAFRGRVRIVAASLLAVAVVSDLAFVGFRTAAVRPGLFVACVDGACTGVAPGLARVIREDETVFAGNALVEALGLLTPAARADFDVAARNAYARLLGRTGGPGVNSLLLRSSPGRVAEVAWLPPGDEPVPCIVFLHGFGGLLTPYLSSLTEALALAGHAIVAPALGVQGDWWTDEGRAVVHRTLDTLPPRIDRDRLFLVGLSNGAVGVSAVAADPELAFRFRAVVALMGASDAFGPPRVPHLLVAAERDDRFELAYLREVQAGLVGGAPVDLVVVPGDHFALFTETASVNAALVGWLATQ